MTRVKEDALYDIMHLLSNLCLVSYAIFGFLYAVTSEENKVDLNSIIEMETKTREKLHYLFGFNMILFLIMFAFLTFCCLFYKRKKSKINHLVKTFLVGTIFISMVVLLVETEIDNPDLDALMEDKTKKSINMFIMCLFNCLILSIVIIMIPLPAFAMIYMIIKKNYIIIKF